MPDGPLIWVTGASQGIGAALVQAVPWDGARIIGVSRSPGLAPAHLTADLADPAGWGMVEASFHRELGGFLGDRVIFVHAAGAIGPIGFVGETDPREYRANLLLNAAAPLILGEAFLRAVRHLTCRRQIVLLSSGAAQRTYPGLATYGAAKAAVDRWVRCAGNEQVRRGNVQVLSVIPGRVATAMHEQLRAASEGQLPDLPEFIRVNDEGLLRDPRAVAEQLWSLLDDENVSSGDVLDLRDYPATGR